MASCYICGAPIAEASRPPAGTPQPNLDLRTLCDRCAGARPQQRPTAAASPAGTALVTLVLIAGVGAALAFGLRFVYDRYPTPPTAGVGPGSPAGQDPDPRRTNPGAGSASERGVGGVDEPGPRRSSDSDPDPVRPTDKPAADPRKRPNVPPAPAAVVHWFIPAADGRFDDGGERARVACNPQWGSFPAVFGTRHSGSRDAQAVTCPDCVRLLKVR
jgi:hypothetical protein